MKDVPVLVAGPLRPSNFNAPTQEVRNLVLSSGQTLSEADVYQLAKAIADYSAVGAFYTGGGAANVYTAVPVSSRYGVHALIDGMLIRFRVPYTNTGASTLAVNSFTAKSIKTWDGSTLPACELIVGETVTVEYHSATDEFRLFLRSSLPDLVPPVGSIQAFNDYNGAALFNSTIYHYNNDDVLSDVNSRLNGKIIVDLSNRYLVGLGTEAAKNIGIAAWSNTPVGNASHQIDLSAVGEPHVHNIGVCDNAAQPYSLRLFSGIYGGSKYKKFEFDISGGGSGINNTITTISSGGSFTNGDAFVSSSSGSAGSSTQSIQVRSVPIRFITRVR